MDALLLMHACFNNWLLLNHWVRENFINSYLIMGEIRCRILARITDFQFVCLDTEPQLFRITDVLLLEFESMRIDFDGACQPSLLAPLVHHILVEDECAAVAAALVDSYRIATK